MNLKEALSDLLSNPTAIAIITTFTVIFTSTIGPEMPSYIKDLFQNDVFRFVVIGLVAYTSSARRPVIALIAAVSFLLIMQLVSEQQTVEKYTQQG